MITDAFDNSKVLFGPKNFYGEQKHLCDKCIIVFSEQIFAYLLETYTYEEAGIIRCCNGITKVYVFEIDGMKIAGYLSHIGSAMASGDVIDVNWLTGANKFKMFPVKYGQQMQFTGKLRQSLKQENQRAA